MMIEWICDLLSKGHTMEYIIVHFLKGNQKHVSGFVEE